ncbi:MAG: hypothetical protein AAF297_11560, partial [Planctomycetota bacterium]
MPTPEALLPTRQHRYDGLNDLDERVLHGRREGVFLVFAGLFLGTLAMLNILGITRFIKLFEIDFDQATPGATAPHTVSSICSVVGQIEKHEHILLAGDHTTWSRPSAK